VEFVVAAGIIAILAAVIFKTVAHSVDKSEAVRCASNLRSLHTSLSAYVQDKGHWPQEPESVWGANNNATYEDWWMKELEPYGASEQVWQCRTIMRKVTNKSKDKRPRMHYVPTMFDKNPLTPYKWSTQPWLIEIGNMHGVGALICFPDGSIRTMDEVTRGR
jgi:type II secretory pathway pseudopilin PulG